ncbi:hypothetical protein LAZ67_22000132, partial [Cordylochernes scorpioides]
MGAVATLVILETNQNLVKYSKGPGGTARRCGRTSPLPPGMPSLQDKALLVNFLNCDSKSATEALRAFRSFKDIRSGKGPMSFYSLKRLIKSVEETGSLEAKPRSGRPSTCKTVAVTVLQNAEAIETLSTYGEFHQERSYLLESPQESHHDILITKLDKGSQVVVLKVDDYKKKMSDILSDSDTFQEISPERVCAISDAYKSSLRLLRRNECITPNQFQQFTSNLSSVPYIYGLPKTHKPSVPLRPIVAYHLSPALQLAKYLSSLLKPLVKTHNLYSVQDPSDFFTRLKSVPQPRGLTMSTFDVTSLFLCLPHSLIIDGLEQLLSSSTLPSNNQKTILDLFTICLDMKTLEFNGCFFVQMRGSPMGSPLSTIAAEIVMSNLDRWLVSHNHLGIEMWSRDIGNKYQRLVLEALLQFHQERSYLLESPQESHHDILITKSDKGSQVVVLKVDDYKKKMSDILSDSDTFQEISPERVCAISDAYRLLRRNECITLHQFQQFTSNLSSVPYIYGLPKTHKPSVPLRPIVAYHLSPALQLAKYLSSLLKPLVKTHNLYSVQDPSDFFTRLKSVPQPRGLTMSTFDVTSLFLCLPHSLIIDGLEQLLSSSTLPSNNQKTILDLFTICLDMKTLEFNGCFFVQMRGSPMGSPLSTIAAEIVMSNLDRWLVSHNHLGIEMWS